MGDAAGFLNSLRLKGIHLAMKSGMLAAETAFDAVVERRHVRAALARFDEKIRDELDRRRDAARCETCISRSSTGLFAGLAFSGLSLLTRGWWIRDPIPSEPGHERMQRIDPTRPSGARLRRSSPIAG